MNGFHSQGGWIAFNGIAIGFRATAQHLPWFSIPQGKQPVPVRMRDNPLEAYLVPFLVILASAMLSRAASGSFERFYPLRVFAA